MCEALRSLMKEEFEEEVEKGVEKGRIEVAINMIKSDFKLDDIVKLTGLPLTKVQELLNGSPA